MSPARRPALICVLPNASIDKTAVVDRFVAGQIHRPSELVAVPGGKALNVARAARSIGVPVRTVLLLAGHAGQWIDGDLRRRRIDHDVTWSKGETRTCLSVLDLSSGQLTEVYEPGPAVSDRVWDRFVRRVAGVIRSQPVAPLVAISGSLPRGLTSDAAAVLVRAAVHAGGRVLLDAGGGALEAALRERPSLVKVNALEAESVIGQRVDSEAGALAAAKALVRGAVGTAVVTLGARGAVAWDGGAGWAVDAPAGGGPHTVGSGDAFLAGLAAGLRRSEPLDACLRRGAAVAAASTLVPGAGTVDREAIAGFAAATVTRRLG